MSLQLSLIAYKMGDMTAALEKVSHSLALNGIYVNGLLHRAHLYRRLKMYGQAIQDLKAAQKLDPNIGQYRKWITETENEAGRHFTSIDLAS